MAHPYGERHKRDRAAAIADLREGEDMCPFCRRPLFLLQRLDFDHIVPVVEGGADGPKRLSHASCNRAEGARLGNRRRPGANRPGHSTASWDSLRCSGCDWSTCNLGRGDRCKAVA